MKPTAHHRKPPSLIAIVGPTAVGKTALSVAIARKLQTEIISADSRQFYQELNIGTAKPTKDDMDGVVHHFINNLSIDQPYDVGLYEKEAVDLLGVLFGKQQSAILTGGSGLYIDAVCNGVDTMPSIPADLRDELNYQYSANGLKPLIDRLVGLDPAYAAQVDRNNPQRIIRALEVCIASGKTYSSFRKSTRKKRPFHIIKIGLNRDREELYQRIDLRMDIMIEQGLFEEAERLYKYRSCNALQTVGYKEVFDFMAGLYDREEAIRLLKRNSRRYAKRQMTWFRKDESISWFHPSQEKDIISHISKHMSSSPDPAK